MFQGPGQYFLRPMMKEYKFEPQSQMIDVLEGATINVEVKSTRVAYRLVHFITANFIKRILAMNGAKIKFYNYSIFQKSERTFLAKCP